MVAKAPATRYTARPKYTPTKPDLSTYVKPSSWVVTDGEDTLEIIPGEVETDVEDFPIGSTVELSCPVCQAPMTCVLHIKNSITINGVYITTHTYDVTSRLCDCPDIELRYK